VHWYRWQVGGKRPKGAVTCDACHVAEWFNQLLARAAHLFTASLPLHSDFKVILMLRRLHSLLQVLVPRAKPDPQRAMSQTTASTDTNTPYPAWSTSGGLDAPHSAGESTGAPAPTVLQSAASMVYLSYTPETLPPKPPGSWTRFVCVSDTHTRAFPVPPGDVLLHGGDLTHVGRVAEFRKTVGWLSSLPHPQKM
jgi:hypothetical protein